MPTQPISEMKAQTLGVGELIVQRKNMYVSELQRDYAWTVEEYLEDIILAMKNGDHDYFIGLIVSVFDTSDGGRWQVVDGQQRLATTTMIYSAIAQWLSTNGFEPASHNARKFIGSRDREDWFDESIKPILTLNVNNSVNFRDFVANEKSEDAIIEELQKTAKHDSNRIMLDAVLKVRRKVSEFAKSCGEDLRIQAKGLNDLGIYLESNVRVVEVAVPSESDASKIFESLNDRGLDLTIMDLVKNYMLNNVESDGRKEFLENWVRISTYLRDKDGAYDDFLRVYWTSLYGRIQKGKLYSQWRSKFPKTQSILQLSRDMVIVAEQYASLDVAESEIWSNFGKETKD